MPIDFSSRVNSRAQPIVCTAYARPDGRLEQVHALARRRPRRSTRDARRSTVVRRSSTAGRSTIEHVTRDRPVRVHQIDRRIEIALDVHFETVIDAANRASRAVVDRPLDPRPPLAEANDRRDVRLDRPAAQWRAAVRRAACRARCELKATRQRSERQALERPDALLRIVGNAAGGDGLGRRHLGQEQERQIISDLDLRLMIDCRSES